MIWDNFYCIGKTRLKCRSGFLLLPLKCELMTLCWLSSIEFLTWDLWLMWGFESGLPVYWLSSNSKQDKVFSILQNTGSVTDRQMRGQPSLVLSLVIWKLPANSSACNKLTPEAPEPEFVRVRLWRVDKCWKWDREAVLISVSCQAFTEQNPWVIHWYMLQDLTDYIYRP